jgi:hypothetical protein
MRQTEANRRNAQLSTGPVTEEGKRSSRRNAVRHGLTAETVIGDLEDAEDYAAFEMAVTADFDAQTAVERELVLRLASLLWRLRRATTIESGLFKIQAQLAQFRGRRRRCHRHEKMVDHIYKLPLAPENNGRRRESENCYPCQAHGSHTAVDDAARADDLTRSFVRLTTLSTYPLDRLSRYEARLWRQICQALLTLRCLARPNSLQRRRLR